MSESSELREAAVAYGQPAGTAGLPPEAPRPEPWSHPWHDQLGLLYHRAMAEKIRGRPELLDIAKSNLRRWFAAEPGANPSAARREWLRILETESVEEILRVMTDPTEEGHRRRQSTPFVGILTREEIQAIRRQFPE